MTPSSLRLQGRADAKRDQVLQRLQAAWTDFEASYAGLSPTELLVPGVTGQWSVRDIIAHVTWWDEEALLHLPVVRNGGRPERYSVKYGGIHAFNALMTEQRRALSLAEVLRQHDQVHQRLVEYVQESPAELFVRETRFRRRLRLDTYGHYPIHATAIRNWRGMAQDEGRDRPTPQLADFQWSADAPASGSRA